MNRRAQAPWIALALLLACDALFAPGFLRIENHDGRLTGALVDIVHRAVPVALLALGMTPVIATGGVDLSVGATMALAASILARLVAGEGVSLPLAVVAALGAGGALGAWNGALVAHLRLAPILATLVLLTVGRGAAQLLSGAGIARIDNSSFAGFGRLTWFGLPSSAFLVLALFAAFALVARRTTLGLHVEAIGGNREAARRSGVPVSAVLVSVYVLSGVCAALAGLVTAAEVGAADASRIGQYLELDAILAVVIGGTVLSGGRMHVFGALGGALVNQALSTSLYLAGASPAATLCAKAVVLLVVVLLASERGLALFVRTRSHREPA